MMWLLNCGDQAGTTKARTNLLGKLLMELRTKIREEQTSVQATFNSTTINTAR